MSNIKDVVVPEGWDIKTIKELNFDISDGNYSAKYPKQEDFIEHGVPFIRANNIKKMKVIDKDMRFISEKQHGILLKGHLKKNDILITTRGEIGQIGIAPDNHINSNINAQIVRINTNNKLNHLYFAYYIQIESSKKILKTFETGTALKQLPVGNLIELPLMFPQSIQEQEKIADILSTVDDAIEKTDALIEKYKKIKTGLMEDLFTKGIDVNTGKPHTKFKESELGKIPESWDIKKLENILEGNKCSSGIYKEKSLYGNGMKILKISDVFKKDFYLGEEINRAPISRNEHINNSVYIGDIIIAIASVKLEGVGKVLYVNHINGNTVFDHNVARIRVNKALYNSNFLCYVFKSLIIRSQIIKMATQVGTTFLKTSTINTFLIPQLSIVEQEKIVEILSGADKKIEKEEAYKEKLEKIKKGLINDLLTGAVRVEY